MVEPKHTFASSEIKSNWGMLARTANRRPVVVTSYGHPAYVVTTISDYENLLKIKKSNFLAEIDKGLDQLDRGMTSDVSVADIIARAEKEHQAERI